MPIFTKLALILFLLMGSPPCELDKPEWGFYGHRTINRLAVFTLPPQMIGFYKANIDLITRQSVNPDMRRYSTKLEGVRHFIDLDEHIKEPNEVVATKLHVAIAQSTKVFSIGVDGDSTLLMDTRKYTKPTGKNYANRRVQIDTSEFLVWNESKIMNGQRESYEYSFEVDQIPDWLKLTSKRKIEKVVIADEFSKHGIAPYFLEQMFKNLVWAFKNKEGKNIIRLSAELGHYLADIHVPLHTTKNYNGADTDQIGIHAFWESRLPELYAEEHYDFMVGKADYILDINAFIWKTVYESFSLVPDVLSIERELSKTFPSDQQYCYEERNDKTVRLECEQFANAYHEAMGGMVERRMQSSISGVGSFWYSAWVQAGQPNLGDLTENLDWAQEEEESKELTTKYESGNIKGRKHNN